jgi:type I restriction enzyme M protein
MPKTKGTTRAKAKSNSVAPDSAARVGFEAKLWQMANKLRNNMHADENKHVVLGLMFLEAVA